MTGLFGGALGGLFGAYQQQKQQRQDQDRWLYNQILSSNLYPNPYLYQTPTKLRCRYCGNRYEKAAVAASRNCPTCAGSWE